MYNKHYNEKEMVSILGVPFQTARSRLERQIILHFGQKCGFGNCYQCGFPIEDYKEMSIEHKIPWSGNSKRNTKPCPEMFWDLDNIALSHYDCNYSASMGGTGKFSLVGVQYVLDKRNNNEYARGGICYNGKPFTLGYYKNPEEAAISYDIMVFPVKNGCRKLNFEFMREIYKIKVEDIGKEKFLQFLLNKNITKILKPLVKDLYENYYSNPQTNTIIINIP